MITPPAPMITAEGMLPEVIAVLQEACDSKKPWNVRDVAAARAALEDRLDGN